MVEFFTQYVSWWHWIVLGILFIILEMATGTFVVLGFGIAAVMVGVLDLIIPMNFLAQVAVWILLAIVIITISFKYFKAQATVSNTGQSNYGFDTLGTVTQTIAPHARGKVRFDTPVLGNSTWSATSDMELKINTRVIIKEVQGQLINVIPAQQTSN